MSDPKPTAPAPAPVAPKLPELTGAEKKALREQARREVKAAEKARLEAEAEKKAAPAPATKAAALAAPLQLEADRTDTQRVADAANFLRGVLMPIIGVLAFPFGYRLRLADFSPEKAREDATAWVPVVRRYRWIDLVITWAGVPARIVSRVRELAERRTNEPAP